MNNISKKQYENYFTAGELASMFGISKQSLLFMIRSICCRLTLSAKTDTGIIQSPNILTWRSL